MTEREPFRLFTMPSILKIESDVMRLYQVSLVIVNFFPPTENEVIMQMTQGIHQLIGYQKANYGHCRKLRSFKGAKFDGYLNKNGRGSKIRRPCLAFGGISGVQRNPRTFRRGLYFLI